MSAFGIDPFLVKEVSSRENRVLNQGLASVEVKASLDFAKENLANIGLRRPVLKSPSNEPKKVLSGCVSVKKPH